MSVLKFISFGSNEKYVDIALKSLSEIKIIYPKAEVYISSPASLPKEIILYAERFSRGYGYWMWKPFIIKSLLCESEYDDIVVYVDGRCGIPSRQISWINSYFEECNTNSVEFTAWQMQHIEKKWTSLELMSKFNIDINSHEANSGQYAGGILAMKKTNNVINLIDDWLNFLIINNEYCRDSFTKSTLNPEFIENRHDQSVLSLLLKTKYNYLMNIKTLTDKNIYEEPSFVPHQKPHPT